MRKYNILISCLVVIIVTLSIVVYNNGESQTIPASHLMNSGHSLEKCDVLLDIGFYAKVGHLLTDEENSLEEQVWMYGQCIEITEHILSKNT